MKQNKASKQLTVPLQTIWNNVNSLRVDSKSPYDDYTCKKQGHEDEKMFDKLLAKQRQQAVDRPVTINLNSLCVKSKPPYHGYTCMKQVHEDKKMFDKLVSSIVSKTKPASG
ncbi:hypothetical protein J6590_099987 [Homalodisca vitripennis]|nr:hypothetical protein J6590_099987 [Homalodisca vitripennis]